MEQEKSITIQITLKVSEQLDEIRELTELDTILEVIQGLINFWDSEGGPPIDGSFILREL